MYRSSFCGDYSTNNSEVFGNSKVSIIGLDHAESLICKLNSIWSQFEAYEEEELLESGETYHITRKGWL